MSISPLTAPIQLDGAADGKPVVIVGERSVKNDDGSVTTPLIYPVKSGAEPLTFLKMRRATAKELREVDGLSGVANVLALIGKLAAQPPSVTDQIDAEDLGELSEVLKHFLPKDRRFGAGSA